MAGVYFKCSKNDGVGAQIVAYFGVIDIQILSSSEYRQFVAIKGCGLHILGYRS